MQKWEYVVYAVSEAGQYRATMPEWNAEGDDIIDSQWRPINDLGAEGWEAVGVLYQSHVIFKREIKPPTQANDIISHQS